MLYDLYVVQYDQVIHYNSNKSQQMFYCFIKIIIPIIIIRPIFEIMLTLNLTTTFSKIQYIECTCNMILINNVFILKTNCYKICFLYNTLHINIKNEVCSLRYNFIECLSFVIFKILSIIFLNQILNIYSEKLFCCHY